MSPLSIDDGVFEVLATAGDTHLGEDFDDHVIDYLVNRHCWQGNVSNIFFLALFTWAYVPQWQVGGYHCYERERLPLEGRHRTHGSRGRRLKLLFQDVANRKHIEAFNSLSSFFYGLKSQLGNQSGLGGKLSDEDKVLLSMIKEATGWIKDNGQTVGTDDLEEK